MLLITVIVLKRHKINIFNSKEGEKERNVLIVTFLPKKKLGQSFCCRLLNSSSLSFTYLSTNLA